MHSCTVASFLALTQQQRADFGYIRLTGTGPGTRTGYLTRNSVVAEDAHESLSCTVCSRCATLIFDSRRKQCGQCRTRPALPTAHVPRAAMADPMDAAVADVTRVYKERSALSYRAYHDHLQRASTPQAPTKQTWCQYIKSFVFSSAAAPTPPPPPVQLPSGYEPPHPAAASAALAFPATPAAATVAFPVAPAAGTR